METVVEAVIAVKGEKKHIRVSGTHVVILQSRAYITFEEGKLEILQGQSFVPFHTNGYNPTEVANDILARASRNEIDCGKEKSIALVEIKSMHKIFAALVSCFSAKRNIVMEKKGRSIPNQILSDSGYAVLVAATEDTLYYQDENLEGVMVDMASGSIICSNDGLVQGCFQNDMDEEKFVYENPDAHIQQILIPADNE